MELIWDSLETVTIPNVGTVSKGVKFSIDDDRGKDLLERGLASRPTLLKPKVNAPETGKKFDASTNKKIDASRREE